MSGCLGYAMSVVHVYCSTFVNSVLVGCMRVRVVLRKRYIYFVQTIGYNKGQWELTSKLPLEVEKS